MLLSRLWNFLRGYVIVLIEGYYLERFINICMHRKISLWDIRRVKNRKIVLKISIKNFKMIRSVCRKAKCKAKIKQKKGLPFIVKKYRGRKAFVLGAMAFVLILYTLASFIWAIEINGNTYIENDTILENLESIGIKPGIIKYGVDTDEIADCIMMKTDKLAWVGVSINGTKIKIELVERKEPPELVSRDVPCHIIAGMDGVIESIITKEGRSLVHKGDTVEKGQVLISGEITSEIEEIEPRYVHAMGEVTARTWYEETKEVCTTEKVEEHTGNIKNKYYLIWFTKKINLLNTKKVFENYDKINIVKRITIGKDMVLPFGVIIERFYEKENKNKKIEIKRAKQLAVSYAYDKILCRIPPETRIVKTSVQYKMIQDETLLASIIVECEEEIGVEKRIGGM